MRLYVLILPALGSPSQEKTKYKPNGSKLFALMGI